MTFVIWSISYLLVQCGGTGHRRLHQTIMMMIQYTPSENHDQNIKSKYWLLVLLVLNVNVLKYKNVFPKVRRLLQQPNL